MKPRTYSRGLSMHWLWKTLTGRLTLFLLAAFACTAVIYSAVERTVHSALIRRDSEKEFSFLAHQSLTAMLYAMRREPPKSLDEVLRGIVEGKGARWVHLLDVQGVIRHSSDSSRIGTTSPHFRPDLLAGGEVVTTEEAPDGSLATLLKPIVNEPRCQQCHQDAGMNGIFEVGIDTTQLAEGFREARWWARASVAVSLIFILGLLWLLLRRFLIGPVAAFLASMRRVGSGDLQAMETIPSPAEYRELSAQFNSMVGKLREAREELDRTYQERMARAGRLVTMGEMAATMAHEIQNPLAGISGALQVLRNDPVLGERREIVEEVIHNVERLANTTRELLDFSHPPLPNPSACDVNQCVRSVMKLIRPDGTRAPSIELVEELAADLPPVWIDPQHLHQVLINVCLNAIQALPAGGRVEVKTRTVETPEGSRVRISVADDGVGISGEDLGRIFEPFFTTKIRGTGLGLSISRNILKSYHGRIELKSRQGQGTEVEIEIPAAMPGPAA